MPSRATRLFLHISDETEEGQNNEYDDDKSDDVKDAVHATILPLIAFALLTTRDPVCSTSYQSQGRNFRNKAKIAVLQR